MMTISANFTAGTNIDEAFKEAIQKANILNCCIEFNFNGVSCHAPPYSDYEKGVREWKKAMRKEETIKVAFS